MSPYMKAYESGIKLAQYQWRSKYAEDDDGTYLTEDQANQLDRLKKQRSLYMESPEKYPDIDLSQILRDIETRINEIEAPAAAEQSAPAPASSGQIVMGESIIEDAPPSDPGLLAEGTQNTGDPAMSPEYNEASALGAAPVAAAGGTPQVSSTQFGAPSLTRGQSNLFNTQLNSIDPSLVSLGNRLQAAPAPAPAAPLAAPVVAQSAPAAAPEAVPAIEEDPLEKFEREQRELAMNTFNVQSGGYGRQLRRFRDQFGEGNEDLFQGDNAVNYRQFAQAMDNRGLQVGDTFDARKVIQNLRAMRNNEGPVETPTETSRVGVQRRGREAKFQTMQQQRAAADRIRSARSSAAANIPQAKTTPVADLPTLDQSPNMQTVELPQRATPTRTPTSIPEATPTRTPTPSRSAARSLAAAENAPTKRPSKARSLQRIRDMRSGKMTQEQAFKAAPGKVVQDSGPLGKEDQALANSLESDFSGPRQRLQAMRQR